MREEVAALHMDDLCYRDGKFWRARLPLICYFVVELYLPHRVPRQFGKLTPMQPEIVSTSHQLHGYVTVTSLLLVTKH